MFKTAGRHNLRNDLGFGGHELAYLRGLFAEYDWDKSGEIARGELIRLIEELSLKRQNDNPIIIFN